MNQNEDVQNCRTLAPDRRGPQKICSPTRFRKNVSSISALARDTQQVSLDASIIPPGDICQRRVWLCGLSEPTDTYVHADVKVRRLRDQAPLWPFEGKSPARGDMSDGVSSAYKQWRIDRNLPVDTFEQDANMFSSPSVAGANTQQVPLDASLIPPGDISR